MYRNITYPTDFASVEGGIPSPGVVPMFPTVAEGIPNVELVVVVVVAVLTAVAAPSENTL